MQHADKYAVLFFDDNRTHFKERDLCACVLALLSPAGTRTELPAAFRDDEDVSGLHAYRGGGLSTSSLRTLDEKWSAGELPLLKLVVFDWDQTVSRWNGLPFRLDHVLARLTPTQRKTLWRSMLGSDERRALLKRLLTRPEAHIVTNQSHADPIRHVLKAWGREFDGVKVVGRQERRQRSKFSYIRSMVKNECDSCTRPVKVYPVK
jgi:hypothetical protein